MRARISDNSDVQAKVAIRAWALDHAGGKDACVLELFGGAGAMYEACYNGRVRKHLAFDLKGSERGTWLQGDNRILVQKHVNGWSLYDADAYVNPWIVLSDICRLRNAGKFVFVATCYLRRTMSAGIDGNGSNRGGPAAFVRAISGYKDLTNCPILIRYYDDFVRQIFGYWRSFGVKVLEAKRCQGVREQTGQRPFYYALTCQKS